MALKKRKIKLVTLEDLHLSFDDEVRESCLWMEDPLVNVPACTYENFPEDPQENSINELILFFKNNQELFDQFKEGKKDQQQKGLPEWLYISEFFKRHNCFGSTCVKKAVENLLQLEKFFLSGVPAPSATPSCTVVPWTKASLEPAVQPAVIGEILLLLANLHYDCVRTHEKLRREIDITEYITCQIDEMGEKKLKTIAAAVQMGNSFCCH
ncbi:Hypothetical predicted protein [Octopus vulgaris]|uniref:Uncharacterized protein n=1 Tax=Octopus vulgaris TaxID=6645 RepID=A0AA36B1A8_OCTVU|nr:Hypothetical predicted protein [Octopus vulgaris]